ncbi:aminoacyl tRNA synthase complex-interacting multifunctional protein 2 [Copidosoma floridanum]|uniref:aminoacyl tRNA synthase complex-interacting multifunctional protein 2 n=1 Tax=Copidosoma floridanum TaxID=29053 RepID=UPI0006C9ABC7|nr:aminoacyl tRNA synthase complex-interacting multifunctional protein 2 [Copidosoma floridanum]
MYALKPIVALPEQIPLPKVMYELPKIHGGEARVDEDQYSMDIEDDFGRQKLIPEYDFLEARQAKILKEVFELKSYLDQLTIAVRLNDFTRLELEPLKIEIKTAFKNKKVECHQSPVNAEIIVNANPASPPYVVLALQRIWTDTKFNVKVHTNSCYGAVARNSAFEDKLLTTAGVYPYHNIDVTLIWKNVKDTQLITRVYDFPFEGEANILRYLARLVEEYNYEELQPEVSISIDNVLDLCLQLPYDDARQKNATIVKFATYLGENPWLLNSLYPSIVDIAVWSVLKRESNYKIPSKLETWFDLCEETFLSG